MPANGRWDLIRRLKVKPVHLRCVTEKVAVGQVHQPEIPF